MRLARLARNRLAARYLKEPGEQRAQDQDGDAHATPESCWRMAMLQVHRRSRLAVPDKVLQEPRFESFARLRTIGYFLNIPRSQSLTQGRDIAEYNECIAEMTMELDSARAYLPPGAVAQVAQLLSHLPPLPAMPTRAELMRILGDAYVDGFDSAFESFITSYYAEIR